MFLIAYENNNYFYYLEWNQYTSDMDNSTEAKYKMCFFFWQNNVANVITFNEMAIRWNV